MQNCCLWTRDKTRMVAHNSRVTAKPKTSWQKQKHHGKTKNLTAKTKYLMAKPKPSRQKQNTLRQNQNPHGKNKIPHGKTKNLMAKPNTSQQKQNSFGFAVSNICFCREEFGFCCEVFSFAVRSLVSPWGFWFCHEVYFCFCREVFGFAVTVVGHRRPPPAPPARYLEESNFQNRSTVLYVINFTFHLLLAYIVLWYRKIKNWRKTLNKKNIPW